MNENEKQNISVSLYVCKALALLSIITAHTTMVLHSGFGNVIKQRFSAIGVIVFMIISGYLYQPEKYGSSLNLIKKKFKSIVIPWVFLGTIVFFWGQVHSFSWENITLFAILKFVLGYKTFLYYIPVLLICYVLFYRYNRITLIGSMLITIISLSLTSAGVLDSFIPQIGLTHYLNVFNWMGIFALGIAFREYDIIAKFSNLIKKKRTVFWIIVFSYLFFCVIIGLFVETEQAGYFSKFGLVMEIFAFFVVLSVSQVSFLRKRFMIQISKRSYCIYLIHTMVLSLLMNVPLLNGVLSAFLPLSALIFANLLIAFAEKIAKLIHCEKVFEVLLGIRVIKSKVE